MRIKRLIKYAKEPSKIFTNKLQSLIYFGINLNCYKTEKKNSEKKCNSCVSALEEYEKSFFEEMIAARKRRVYRASPAKAPYGVSEVMLNPLENEIGAEGSGCRKERNVE